MQSMTIIDLQPYEIKTQIRLIFLLRFTCLIPKDTENPQRK